MKLVILSGLSGAGKTVALKQYEDLGFYCIDNLPLQLVGPIAGRALRAANERFERLAIGIDAREHPREIEKFPRYLRRLQDRGVETRIVFLHADDATILHRYSETRRKHPLSSDQVSLGDAIRLERKLLEPISALADAMIDTSGLNLYQLRELILGQIPGGGAGKLSVLFLSFGYKNGVPGEADYVFDIRVLPNPHWDPALRKLTGRDAATIAWLERQAPVPRMLHDIRVFLEQWLPEYQKQDRAYVTVAIGCTGGRHRSVYFTEQLGQAFKDRFDHVSVKHREIWDEPPHKGRDAR